MESETYLERQEDEVEFLQCVFMNDFEDLRNKDPWKVCIDMKCECMHT